MADDARALRLLAAHASRDAATLQATLSDLIAADDASLVRVLLALCAPDSLALWTAAAVAAGEQAAVLDNVWSCATAAQKRSVLQQSVVYTAYHDAALALRVPNALYFDPDVVSRDLACAALSLLDDEWPAAADWLAGAPRGALAFALESRGVHARGLRALSARASVLGIEALAFVVDTVWPRVPSCAAHPPLLRAALAYDVVWAARLARAALHDDALLAASIGCVWQHLHEHAENLQGRQRGVMLALLVELRVRFDFSCWSLLLRLARVAETEGEFSALRGLFGSADARFGAASVARRLRRARHFARVRDDVFAQFQREVDRARSHMELVVAVRNAHGFVSPGARWSAIRRALRARDVRMPQCPITLDIMCVPVRCDDGHTYEQSAIDRWLDEGDGRSPLTRARIDSYAIDYAYVRTVDEALATPAPASE